MDMSKILLEPVVSEPTQSIGFWMVAAAASTAVLKSCSYAGLVPEPGEQDAMHAAEHRTVRPTATRADELTAALPRSRKHASPGSIGPYTYPSTIAAAISL
jgi:hypothetical protein